MSQEHLTTAVPSKPQLFHYLRLLCLRHLRTVKVRALAIGISLEFLEATLIVQPLVSKKLSAVHTAYRDDHLTLAAGLAGPRQTLCG